MPKVTLKLMPIFFIVFISCQVFADGVYMNASTSVISLQFRMKNSSQTLYLKTP